MNREWVFFGIAAIGLLSLSVILIPSEAVVSSIPPTRAFLKIFSGLNNVTANSFAAPLFMQAGNGIAITVFHNNNALLFSTSGSAGTTAMEGLTNVTRQGCASGQARVVNSTGWYVCSNVGVGDVTGAANIGTGTGTIFKNEAAGTLNLKTLKEGSNISITNNADDITISASGSTGPKVFNQTSAKDRFVTGINNVTGGITTNVFSVNSQTAAVDQQITGIDNVTGAITRNTFSVNTKAVTCSGTDKVSTISIDNSTGNVIVTCTADTAG